MKTVFMYEQDVEVPDIGDKRVEKIYANGHDIERPTQKGTVIYVHPKLRFYTVQFGVEPFSFRESYIIGR